ncbi:hypothetical protein FACS1894189_8750 [Planctomycetales bacterium]|nr:hypothetical protein FACS1894189_8750 [Planctomycetales bacterium]
MEPKKTAFSEEDFLKAHDNMVLAVADQMSRELFEQNRRRAARRKSVQKQNETEDSNSLVVNQ